MTSLVTGSRTSSIQRRVSAVLVAMMPVALPASSSTFQAPAERGTRVSSNIGWPLPSMACSPVASSMMGSCFFLLVSLSVPKARLRTQKPEPSEAGSKASASMAAAGTPAAAALATSALLSAASSSPLAARAANSASTVKRKLSSEASPWSGSTMPSPSLMFRFASGR